MFEKLFKYPKVLARHRDGPFAKERERFLLHKHEQGAARATLVSIARELLVVARELRPNPGRAISLAEVQAAADRWARRQRRRGRSQGLHWPACRFAQVARDWLRFLGRLQESEREAVPYAPLLEDFASVLHGERGLSPSTIGSYSWQVSQFLGWLSACARPFAQVTVRDVDAYLALRGQSWSRVSSATSAKALRAFFRHAERRGWCVGGIADAIECPRIFRQEALPAGPCWEEVRQLIPSAQSTQPRDIRDRAILLLFSVYGWRSGEVRRLRLEDIDWERERVVVARSKQRRSQEYPLTRTAGEAIVRYLLQVRPRCRWREVFLTLKAPFRPLSPSGLYHVASSRFLRLGIAALHRGPHSLRHACAAHLLAQGLSFKEIGDHLGHRSPDATRVYAKVDLAGLREVARFDLGRLK